MILWLCLSFFACNMYQCIVITLDLKCILMHNTVEKLKGFRWKTNHAELDF